MTINVPPAAVEAFANQAIALIPEAQTTIERGDQKRKIGSGGGGRSPSAPDAINFTASEALHQLHLLMLNIIAEVDWHHGAPHQYRKPLDAAKEIRVYPNILAEADQIEAQLRAGRKYLNILAREIDLPPEPIPLGECECGEPMVAIEGDEEVVCKRCELPWDVDERKANRRNRILRGLQGQTFTAASAHIILKQCGANIPASTIRTWGERGDVKQDKHGQYSLEELWGKAFEGWEARVQPGIDQSAESGGIFS